MFKFVVCAIYALLLLPIVVLMGASLTAESFIAFPPQGLSWRWYEAFLADGEMVRGMGLSFLIAAATTAIAMVVGVMAALYLSRPETRWKAVTSSLFLSPLSVPMVLTGFATLVVFTQLGLVNGLGLVISHVVVTVPYMMRTVLASTSLSDRSLVRAAAILGAGPWRAFWHVTLPLMRPGIVAGSLFTFLASFNNVTTSVFLSSPGKGPLPVVIFNRMENLAEPSIAAAATVMIVITVVGILILERFVSLFGSLAGSAR